MSEAVGEEITSLELEVLLHAFKDRNLNVYTSLIEELNAKGEAEISLADLETILRAENLEALIPAEQAIPEKIEEEEESVKLADVENLEESKPVVAIDDIELGEMKAEEVEEEEEEEIEEEELEEEETTVVSEPASTQKTNVADDMANFVASQIQSDQPLADLNTMVSGRTRKKIIKKLFKKNENQFMSFINIVNNHSAWKEASVIIDNEFYERGINPYSKEAIMFSDIIYLRFFPKDHYVGEQE